MKNFVESFVTVVIMACIVFASVSLMSAEAELVTARETHSMVLRTVQESDVDALSDISSLQQQLNDSIQAKHSNWTTTIEKIQSSNYRDFYLVTLNYSVNIPLFGAVSRGKIQGYAR